MKKFLVLIIVLFSFSFGQPVLAQTSEASTIDSTRLDSPNFQFDLRSITHEDISTDRLIRGGINYIFGRIITLLAATVGAAAVFMITLGGFMILASAGIQERVDTGKNLIKKAVFGLVITLSAYILVTTVQFLITSIYA